MAEVRAAGAAVRLISDGDIAGIIFTASPEETGIDIYLGTGAAPEGVLAAAAMRCIGGQMQGRLILDTPDRRRRAAEMGIEDLDRKYDLTDLASGDVIVAATGITDGALLRGVRFPTGPDPDRDAGLPFRGRHGPANPRRAPPRLNLKPQAAAAGLPAARLIAVQPGINSARPPWCRH